MPDRNPRVDVAILFALAEEFRELFEQRRSVIRAEKDEKTGRAYYLFECPGPDGTPPYTCVTTLAGQMGPTSMALLADDLLHRYEPATVSLLGIAGALSDDVKAGDIVVATQVDAYLEDAKAAGAPGGEFKFLFAGKAYVPSIQLVNAAHHLPFSHAGLYEQWQYAGAEELGSLAKSPSALVEAGLVRPAPRLELGHLASGPVVGSAKSFAEWLRTRDRKYLALEMEAAGVMAALYERAGDSMGLVLRGISDYTDERKAQLDALGGGALRRLAVRNAISLLVTLMRAGALPRAGAASPAAAAPAVTTIEFVFDRPVEKFDASAFLSALAKEAAVNPERVRITRVWEGNSTHVDLVGDPAELARMIEALRRPVAELAALKELGLKRIVIKTTDGGKELTLDITPQASDPPPVVVRESLHHRVLDLFDQLHPPHLVDQLIFLLGMPPELIPPETLNHAGRCTQVLKWSISPGGPGLRRLHDELDYLVTKGRKNTAQAI